MLLKRGPEPFVGSNPLHSSTPKTIRWKKEEYMTTKKFSACRRYWNLNILTSSFLLLEVNIVHSLGNNYSCCAIFDILYSHICLEVYHKTDKLGFGFFSPVISNSVLGSWDLPEIQEKTKMDW